MAEDKELENEKRFHNFELQLVETQKDVKDIFRAINKLESAIEEIHEMETSVSLLANNMQGMVEELKRQGERLTNLESKSGKRWDSIVEKAIAAIVGGIIAFALFKLGITG